MLSFLITSGDKEIVQLSDGDHGFYPDHSGLGVDGEDIWQVDFDAVHPAMKKGCHFALMKTFYAQIGLPFVFHRL